MGIKKQLVELEQRLATLMEKIAGSEKAKVKSLLDDKKIKYNSIKMKTQNFDGASRKTIMVDGVDGDMNDLKSVWQELKKDKVIVVFYGTSGISLNHLFRSSSKKASEEKALHSFLDFLRKIEKTLPSVIEKVKQDKVDREVSEFVGTLLRISHEDWYGHYYR